MTDEFDMNKDLLPIGSVIKLKKGDSNVMITGYYTRAKAGSEKVFDYSGCPFPIGITRINDIGLFNKDMIKSIVFLGKTGPYERNYLRELSLFESKIKKEN